MGREQGEGVSSNFLDLPQMLAGAGYTAPQAASLMSLLGLSVLVGRIGSGLLHLLSRTVQVDVRVGCGLDSNADDFFTGLGVSFLF